MDLAGLAALLAIPATIIGAVAGPLRDRSLGTRLGRVEKHLADGTVSEPQRRMLENARDHLAERIAMAELRPRLTGWYIVSVWFIAMGIGVLLVLLISGDKASNANPWNWVAVYGGYFGGLVVWNVCSLYRSTWLTSHRDTAYDRSKNPDL